ncbi:MAG TPA: 3-phosphoserine/phosphohydroxythreonine transaminase [Actinomycetota bacterium]|nr:3-phosphoserine/phosphohydroxythreonine transaminase [Actinomycetota bacterium]
MTGRVNERVFNFAPGPATLPASVLGRAQRDLVSLPGIGISPLEISHRSAWFLEVIEEAATTIGGLLDVPPTHRVVFCQGGATQQFSMVPMNLALGPDHPPEYVVTGSWGSKAAAEAARLGPAAVAWSDADRGFTRVPEPAERRLSPGAAFMHVTSNETIEGVQWPALPAAPDGVPLVVDASSDFLSRPLGVGELGLLYAGAQKNAGPAGVTIAIVREDLLERVPAGVPAPLDYRTYVEHGSLFNTPPVFAIYIVMLVTRWLRDEVGGLAEQDRRNRAKASLLYDTIDGSDGFYTGHADPGARSIVNVTFRLPSDQLDARFVAEAAERGLAELKGHRSVGGIRASIYNAMPIDGVEALARFMRRFASANSSSSD